MNTTPIIYSAYTDQPFTCPMDGARTDPISDNGIIYKERCLHCGEVFNFEFDDEEE